MAHLDASEVSMLDLNVKGVKVPVISGYSSVIPAGEVLLVFVGGGDAFNKKPLPIAKLSSYILNHGTKKLGNVAFADLLDSKAVSISASVSASSLSVRASFLKEHIDFTLARLKDLIYDINVTSSSLETNKNLLISNVMSSDADFDYVARTRLREVIFKGTPLEHPSNGRNRKEVAAVSLVDVKNYFRDTLQLRKLVVVVGGDIDVNKTVSDLGVILSGLEVGVESKVPSFQVKSSSNTVAHRDTKQSYIYFSSPLRVGNLRDDDYKAKVAVFILGSSGFGSRLMEEIRVKRGLAYSVHASVTLDRMFSYLHGHMQTSPEKGDEAMEVVKRIYADFVKNGVTEEELQMAKDFITGSRVLTEEKLSSRLAASFSNYYNGLPLNYRDEFIESVEKLDLVTINNYIASHSEILDLTFSVVTRP